jgi:acyl-Coa thioesterase superfamily protein/acyl-CoA thioesterase superfamily protein
VPARLRRRISSWPSTRVPDPLALYVSREGRYEATELTRGPWDPDSQHLGPPCALMGRELDRAGGIEHGRLARLTLEIMRPVPLGLLEVEARVVRPGRRVEMLETELSAPGGEALIRGRGWRIRTEGLEIDEPPHPDPEVPGLEEAVEKDYFPTGQDVGFHTAVEVRFARGGFVEPGPAVAWMRMHEALVEGEEPSQLERVLVCADSGNGVSSPLDYRSWVFINPDLTVQLRRLPEGEWVCLDAVTHAEPDGTGMSEAALHDRRGLIGRATQSILVTARD